MQGRRGISGSMAVADVMVLDSAAAGLGQAPVGKPDKRRRQMRTAVPLRKAVAVLAALVAVLALLVSGTGRQAHARIPETAITLVNDAVYYGSVTTGSAVGDEVTIPMQVTGTVVPTDPPVARCFRVSMTGKMQTSAAGTTGDIRITNSYRHTYSTGVSMYLPQSGGPGGTSYNLTALDRVPGSTTGANYTWTVVLRKVAGAGTVTGLGMPGGGMQLFLEDLGPVEDGTCG